ncbi:MAG: lysophospholipase [Burkholderiales bacterium PBB6]|nr:MAG: lysophospholipase [Burkholderiales bacterium PBB6]
MLGALAKLALAPVLLVQGRQVRRDALRLPEAAGPRAGVAGEGTPVLRLLVVGDSSGAGVGVATQAEALAEPLARARAARLGAAVSWQLLATSGHTAADALAAFNKAASSSELAPADVLVLALGVNDAVGQTRPRAWLRTLDELHAQAVARCGVRLTLHSGLPPVGRFPLLPTPLRQVLGRDARALDAALRAHVAGSVHRHHVPLPELPMLPVSGHHAGPITGSADEAEPGWIAADGFHPGLLGYRAWVAALDAQLAALMPPVQPQP